MSNYYRINVSRNGEYLFATEENGITTFEHASNVVRLFKEKFPEDKGYKIDCMYYQVGCKHVEF